MSNPIFDQRQMPAGPQNMQNALAQLKANPAAILQKAGMNIPQGMNNPQQIVQHLMRSGQVPQGRINQLMQMVGQMRR